MKISQLRKATEKLKEDWREIYDKIQALQEKKSKNEREMGKLRETCPHPIEQQYSHPETGE